MDWESQREELLDAIMQQLEAEFAESEDEDEPDESEDEPDEPEVFDLAGSDSADAADEPVAAASNSAPPASRRVPARAAAGDESDGFEEVSAAPRASRKRQRAETGAAEAAAAALKPQPTECTICYDPCMMAGRHRLVSLKCGHLFGKKCIERWVGERKTCPNCNMVVRRADVRVLFSDHVAVVDNSGVEAMTQKWEAEKSKRITTETELSRAKLQLQMATADAHRCQAEATQWKRRFEKLQATVARDNLRIASSQLASPSVSAAPLMSQPENDGRVDSPTPWGPLKLISPFDPASQPNPGPTMASPVFSSSPSRSQPTRSLRRSLYSLDEAGDPSRGADVLERQQIHSQQQFTEVFRVPLANSRVFAIAPSGSMLCVGESASPVSHGILKLSTVDPRHSARIMVHQQPVRDVALSAREDLALTVTFDGKLAVTNLNSHSVVLQIALPPRRRQGWSCALSASDPNAMYCGFHDGVVAKYDMRRPAGGDSGVVASFELHEKQPVHSIKLFSHGQLGSGLAAATFSGVSVWDRTEATVADSGGLIPLISHASIPGCCSLAMSSFSDAKAVVSTRTQPSAAASHSILNLSALHLTPIGSPLRGHRTPSVLTRSAIWTDAASGKLRVASGDDEGSRAIIWDVASGQIVQRFASPRVAAAPSALLNTPQTIVDVQHSSCVLGGSRSGRGGRELLGVLRQKEIALFSCRVGG